MAREELDACQTRQPELEEEIKLLLVPADPQDSRNALYKSELMMLEMLSEANWERPIYIAVSVGRENQLNMENHFVQEGLAYRFTPFDTSKTGVTIDSEKMYDNLMNKFKFGGIDKPGIYIDENAMRMCHSHRRIFSQLVQQLMREGKKDKAKAALDYAEKMIPAYNVPYDWQNGAVQMAEAYYQLGETAKADSVKFTNRYDPPAEKAKTTAARPAKNTAAPAARTAKGSAAPALPQTGDAFPVEALAAALCAGLVGFATAWSKHR